MSVPAASVSRVLVGRVFRVRFTPPQAELAHRTADACRAVYNTGLEQRRHYRRSRAWINYRQQAAELAEAKQEHVWLQDVPSQPLQQALMDLNQACAKHSTFRVHWRSARRWEPSFRFPTGKNMQVVKLNRRWSQIKLPSLGWVKYRATRSISGETIRSATLRFDGQHWYVSVLTEDGTESPAQHAAPANEIGVDRGVAVAVATSAGELLDQVFTTKAEKRKALRLQRKLSRAAKTSTNRRKTRARLAAVRARDRRRRQDFCRKTANALATKNATVVVEDLKTRNMTRRATPKPDPDKPGSFLPNGAAAKKGLNQAILSKGWYQFELALVSVSRSTGTEVRKVPAAYTSQRCSECGHVDPKNRESQAEFRCVRCQHYEHADINAAKNVLAAGRKPPQVAAESLNACESHACSPQGETGAVRSRNPWETARLRPTNPVGWTSHTNQ